MQSTTDYSRWSNEQLIQRVTELEKSLKQKNHEFRVAANTASTQATAVASPPPDGARPYKKPKKAANAFDPSKYSTRYIALKFAYLGQRYNGYEHHENNVTPLPTIEEELWKAFMKTRLIFPTRMNDLKEGEIDWDGCEYSKCGRTDRGVSAFGQVIGIRVRSKKPLRKQKLAPVESQSIQEGPQDGVEAPKEEGFESAQTDEGPLFDPIKDEMPYIQVLNRVLPEDIRILAWCPDPPPGFNARFSCKERQYKYFFTNPAFAPVPDERGLSVTAQGKKLREGWLDIDAMQDAAKRLEGLHDFRNFCKIDAAKQITNFQRRIFHAGIEKHDPRRGPVGYVGQPGFECPGLNGEAMNGTVSTSADYSPPAIYSFNVHGSAFLWHQVRHLVAVMFLVGQGLEPPSVVSDLLDMEKYPSRPMYEMAVDAPLVLWDCVFPEGESDGPDAMKWVYVGDAGGQETSKKSEAEGGDGKFGRNSIMDGLWTTWRQRKIDEVLAGMLIDVVAGQGRRRGLPLEGRQLGTPSARVFDGSDEPRTVGDYTPISRKRRLEHYEVVNARFLVRKGRAPATPSTESMDVD